MIGPLGGFFQFAISGVDVLLCLCRVTAEFVLVLSLRLIDLSEGLLEVMLRLGEIRMPVAVNVDDGALGKGVSAQHEATRQQAAQHEVLDFHGFSILPMI
jgi:hypothetical protein